MRSAEVTSSPHGSRPAGGHARQVTLVLRDPCGPGSLMARPRRLTDQLLARLFGSSLDRQLAAGRPPETGRLLAARAQVIVALPRRRALARKWERVLREAGRPAGPGSARLLLCRDRIAAAEPGLRELMARLAVPLPVTAQGVAAAGTLLTDAAGPLYNRRSPISLGAAVRTATGQLDPAAPLLEPATA